MRDVPCVNKSKASDKDKASDAKEREKEETDQ